MTSTPATDGAEWAVALFNRSVLKQEKYRRITSLLEDPADRRNLDIGADNGVIRYLLRRRGGAAVRHLSTGAARKRHAMTLSGRIASGPGQLREGADLETSSEDRARRFAGHGGRW